MSAIASFSRPGEVTCCLADLVRLKSLWTLHRGVSRGRLKCQLCRVGGEEGCRKMQPGEGVNV